MREAFMNKDGNDLFDFDKWAKFHARLEGRFVDEDGILVFNRKLGELLAACNITWSSNEH